MKRIRHVAVPFIALCATLLVGCAGTESYHQSQERNGEIRIDTCDGADCDYKIYIRNSWDIGWDGEDRAQRLNAIKLSFGGGCDDVLLVGEAVIDRGTIPIGSKRIRTYVMKVRCPKAGPAKQTFPRP